MTKNEAIAYLKSAGFPSVLAFQKKYFPAHEQDNVMGSKTLTAVECYKNFSGIRHFKMEEFKCKCGGKHCTGYPAVIDRQLIKNLDYLREDSKAPIKVISGLRCEIHNKEVGGASGSRHKTGKAADIQSPALTPTKSKRKALVKRWKTFKKNRFAYSDSGNMGKSVHLDVE